MKAPERLMNAAELAEHIGAKRAGRQYVCRCPAHEDRAPSLIFFDGRQCIQFRCQAGCHPLEVIAAFRASGQLEPVHSPVNGKRPSFNADERQRALSIFAEAMPLTGTPAEDYLIITRRIDPWWLPTSALNDLRYHPHCPRGEGAGGSRGHRQPALIALMRDVRSGRPAGIHRRYLNGIKPDGKPFTYGPVSGAAIMLTPMREAFVDGICPHLQIAEGLETALAVMLKFGGLVWATGSASNLRNFPILPGLQRLTVRADNDVGAGQRAAEAVVARYGAAADWTMPTVLDTDYAD
jgi:hypothetical protein